MFCSKCGKENEEGSIACAECGAELGVSVDKRVNKKSKKNKIIAIIAGSVLALIIIIFLILTILSNKTNKENFSRTYEGIKAAAYTTERITSLEVKVWYNSIYQIASDETDKYTKDDNGNFYADFNDALEKFYEGESEEISELYSLNETIKNNMNEFKKVSNSYKDEYSAMRKLYIAYSNYADLVLGDTTYSYNSFTNESDKLKDEYKKLEKEYFDAF